MKALVVGAGALPSKRALSFLRGEGYTRVVAADGGADSLRKIGIRPWALVGDFDSIHADTLAYYREQHDCEIVHLARQTDSDVEKCLTFLEGKGCASCVLCGVTGSRFDHALANLALLLRWSRKMHLALIAGRSVAEPARGDMTFPATPGSVLSLFGFSAGLRVQSEGLLYPIHDGALLFGEGESLSNQAAGDAVRLAIRGGDIIVLRDFQELTRHGFLPCGLPKKQDDSSP